MVFSPHREKEEIKIKSKAGTKQGNAATPSTKEDTSLAGTYTKDYAQSKLLPYKTLKDRECDMIY